MFGSTFCFWRRLARTDNSAAVDTDRRLWVRYPASLQANVEPAEKPALLNRVAATVRDISLGGASLTVDRPFEIGQMLSLEIPQQDADSHTVLACVVRALPQADGQWSLGCVFSRELTDADLEAFQARRGQDSPSDQRTWKRFPTRLKASYQKIGDQENRVLAAQVINLSASGVGLEVTEALDAGALLSVDLAAADGKVVRTILACVVHVTTQSSGVWALGCNFIRELSDEDLETLL